MQRFSVVFEGANGLPLPGWEREYAGCLASGAFDVLVVDFEALLDGSAVCPRAPHHDTPTLLRCGPMGQERYKRLAREFLRSGHKLVTDEWPIYSGVGLGWFRGCNGLPTDEYKTDVVRIGLIDRFGGPSFGSDGGGSVPPTTYVLRDDGYPDLEDGAVRAVGYTSSARSTALINRFREAHEGRIMGELFFEREEDLARVDGEEVRWRVFYCGGEPFCTLPPGSDLPEVPRPPEKAIEAFRHLSWDCFYSVDFGLVAETAWRPGRWVCTRALDGQMGPLPRSAPDDFYALLARSLAEVPRVPDWIWCLTGRVVDENETGEEHRVVHGTRHFAPGTKLYLNVPHWDDRVTVIGVPRYSDRPTRISMGIDKIEDFAMERVSDHEIVAGIVEPRMGWPFLCFKPDEVTRGTWDETDKTRDVIPKVIERLNAEAAERQERRARKREQDEAPAKAPQRRIKKQDAEEPENDAMPAATDEFGLPAPKDYDGPHFTVFDYYTDEYAAAQTLGEKIDMRGHKAFVEEVEPEDFDPEGDPSVERLGMAELWAQSTWTEGSTDRDVGLEREVAGVAEGDLIEVMPCPIEVTGWPYAFCRPDGSLLPYQPFHDYDDRFFEKALAGLAGGRRLVCRVRSSECFGGTAAPADPDFNWRVYSAKVMVLSVPLTWNQPDAKR